MAEQRFNLKVVDEWANCVSPVFVVGMTRSGTTMVYNAFRNNLAFRLPCEDDLSPETFLFCSLKSKLPIFFNPMLSEYLGGGEDVNDFISCIGEIISKEKVRFELDEDIVKALSDKQEYLTKWQMETLAKVFFYQASTLTGGKRVLEKTPSHSNHIDDIFTVFPNAKIVHCHRAMVSVLGSIKKRLKKEKELGHHPEQYDWLTKGVEVYVKQYNEAQQSFIAASEKHSGKVFFSSYEEIVDNPVFHLTRLCEFVDIEFDHNMVKGERKGHAEWESYSKNYINKNKYDLNGLIDSCEIEYINENVIDMVDYLI